MINVIHVTEESDRCYPSALIVDDDTAWALVWNTNRGRVLIEHGSPDDIRGMKLNHGRSVGWIAFREPCNDWGGSYRINNGIWKETDFMALLTQVIL